MFFLYLSLFSVKEYHCLFEIETYDSQAILLTKFDVLTTNDAFRNFFFRGGAKKFLFLYKTMIKNRLTVIKQIFFTDSMKIINIIQ